MDKSIGTAIVDCLKNEHDVVVLTALDSFCNLLIEKFQETMSKGHLVEKFLRVDDNNSKLSHFEVSTSDACIVLNILLKKLQQTFFC